MHDHSACLHQFNCCQEEARRIFIENKLQSGAQHLVSVGQQVGAAAVWIVVSCDQQGMYCLGNNNTRRLPSHLRGFFAQSFSDNIPDNVIQRSELRTFLQCVNYAQGETVLAHESAHDIQGFCGVINGARACFVVCLFVETPTDKARSGAHAILEFYRSVIASLRFATENNDDVIKEQQASELVQCQHQLQRLNAQLSEAQQALRCHEKWALIGQLTAGVVHEVNNPIGYVSANVGMLANYVSDLMQVVNFVESLKSDADAATLANAATQLLSDHDIEFLKQDCPSLLKETQQGLERIKTIIGELRGFTLDSEWQSTDVTDCIEAALTIAANELKYKARVHKQYQALPATVCQPDQVTQLITILLINAAQAQQQQGDITITTAVYDTQQIAIVITDTGEGIAETNLCEIFTPFFTTRAKEKHQGLGLWLAQSIVAQHRGQLLCESQLNEATTFTIILPLTQPLERNELVSEGKS